SCHVRSPKERRNLFGRSGYRKGCETEVLIHSPRPNVIECIWPSFKNRHFLTNFLIYAKLAGVRETGGVLVSTWVEKLKEHDRGACTSIKNVQTVIGNDYALAA